MNTLYGKKNSVNPDQLASSFILDLNGVELMFCTQYASEMLTDCLSVNV